jgi:hypothetical protein
MRTIISTLIIFLMTAAVSLNAQPRFGNGNGMNGFHPLISQYGQELNLTDSQMKALAELNLEYRQEFRADWQGRRGSRGQRGSFRGTNRPNRSDGWIQLRSEYHAEVMDILTEDQKETLRNAVQERAEKAHQFRMAQHEVVVDEVGLEGDKRQSVLNLMNDHSRQLLETRVENIETPAFGQYRDDRYDSRSELQNELKELLTVAEYRKLQDVMGTPRFANDGRYGRRGNPRFN